MLNIKTNIALKNKTTMKMGGVAKYYAEVSTKNELLDALRFAKDKDLKIFVLGGGSNVIFSEEHMDALVIKLINDDIDIQGETVTAGAGAIWDEVVKRAVECELQGIECLSFIPGTAGAAPVQNIGAYGQELSETLQFVEVVDLNNSKFTTLSNKELEFSYRDSLLKKNPNRYIVFSITLKLTKKQPTIKYELLKSKLEEQNLTNPSLSQVRQAVISIRKERLEDPATVPNAGSFFTNPIVGPSVIQRLTKENPEIVHYKINDDAYKISAGWLIEQSGWKGKQLKKVGVSKKHALVIINERGGTLSDVKDLVKKINKDVYANFGIKLIPEVQLVEEI